MNRITIAQLRATLNRTPLRKTGGPSGLTYEMLKYMSDVTLKAHILPILNEMITHKQVPTTLKGFNVWGTEKTLNSGSIITMTGKLNIRPISLFEILVKLLETILAHRLQQIMETEKTLHESQFGFIRRKSVEHAMMLYTFLFEDARQYNKELHISANDCSKAYDSVPHWCMRLIYRAHGFPEHLIELLLDLDKGRFGNLLTAHGPGPTFKMKCGLGQGSSIAPLKWNLFLNFFSNGSKQLRIHITSPTPVLH